MRVAMLCSDSIASHRWQLAEALQLDMLWTPQNCIAPDKESMLTALTLALCRIGSPLIDTRETVHNICSLLLQQYAAPKSALIIHC